jgi:enoyl-CoA hydratase/carnithine racemase
MTTQPPVESAETSSLVVEIERHDSVQVCRINRPDRLNALSGQVLLELTEAVFAARADESVHCLVITGAPRADGRPCFSAGVDLKEAAAGQMPLGSPGAKLTNLIDDMLTPSIAVIDGVCTTGALEIAMSCDLRFASLDHTQISDWHLARLGLGLGGWGASTRLARLVGVAQAKDMILTGKVIDGPEALRIGLVQRLFPSSELWQESMKVAQTIAAMRVQGVRATMAHLSRVQDLSKEESLGFATQVREWFDAHKPIGENAKRILETKNS